jgi:hypothetical protein
VINNNNNIELIMSNIQRGDCIQWKKKNTSPPKKGWDKRKHSKNTQ